MRRLWTLNSRAAHDISAVGSAFAASAPTYPSISGYASTRLLVHSKLPVLLYRGLESRQEDVRVRMAVHPVLCPRRQEKDVGHILSTRRQGRPDGVCPAKCSPTDADILLMTSVAVGEAGHSPALAHNRRECPLVTPAARSAPPRTSTMAVQDTLLPALVSTVGGSCRAFARVGG
ncbi:hypothetical protein L226DRAFT_317693 [Lentinus tigrinus ALCF2SS1-7]|uniref:Uncharacterized protein n=1 Tax=Lentinus tigrinus ALCF2SS1-6 TaxID=1328759 RepID=A0A5C2RP91_9APHY|nr:hypothetical protein L227DRAFT_399452 [Lentinus tigrinus ALCF2SS1-6]RPD68682.1 hypothetical protein L226DRAFT_317693 [Lentinus tigrinus ALCF2SS1-7]